MCIRDRVKLLNGQVIRLSPTSRDYVNPLDINLNYSEDENPLALKSDFVLSFCELIMGGKTGLEAIERTVICLLYTSQAALGLSLFENSYRIHQSPCMSAIVPALFVQPPPFCPLIPLPPGVSQEDILRCSNLAEA